MNCYVTFLFGQEHSAYQIEVDHVQSFIRVEALFYSKNNSPEEQEELARGLDFWNSLSNQYVYLLPNGQCYALQFDLKKARGTYMENGFFMPGSHENHSILNSVEIVSDGLLERMSADRNHFMAGYSAHGAVYISRSYATHATVWAHEIGHRLGASHHGSGGVMAASLPTGGYPEVSKATVREILGHAGVRPFVSGSHYHHDMEPAAVNHYGAIPGDFFTEGKLKKQTYAHASCPTQMMNEQVSDAQVFR